MGCFLLNENILLDINLYRSFILKVGHSNHLNGFPREWDSFIKWICARRKLTKFSKPWEECVQKEGRLANREENLNEDEYQALVVHTNNGINKRKDQGYPISRSLELKKGKKFKKDYSSYECYTCHNLGHVSRDCPLKKNKFKNKNEKFHAHAAEENESGEESTKENEESNEEYVLISSLTG